MAQNDYADLGFVKAGADDHSDLGFVPTAPLPKYDPMQGLEDTLRAIPQGLTLGHLPQIQGAIESGAISGPQYEASKNAVRAKLAEGAQRNPQLTFAGDAIGSMATNVIAPMTILKAVSKLPMAMRSTYLAAMMRGQALPKAVLEAAPGAVAGFAQNPGGDIDESGALKKRLLNAAGGGTLTAILGALKSGAGAEAERQASYVAGLPKSEIRLGYKSGKPATIGRAMLDKGVIGNRPVSKETLYLRANDAANKAGAEKGEVIKIIEDELRDPILPTGASPAPGSPNFSTGSSVVRDDPAAIIDARLIEKRLRDKLYFNDLHPDAEDWANSVDRFSSRLARNLPNQPHMTMSEADKLKVDTGNMINWKKPRADFSPEEKRNAALYDALNGTLDETMDYITQKSALANPHLEGRLQRAKSDYGSMDTARKSLLERIAADESRKTNMIPALGPIEYGIGGLGLAGSLLTDTSNMGKVGVTVGSMAAAKLARKYGRQVLAKQLDNASRALNYQPFYSAAVALPPGIAGEWERRESPWSNMRTTKE